MNILLLVGVSLFLGILGGNFFKLIRVPQVVGYIIIGVFLGSSVFGVFDSQELEVFAPLINFILGIIGFLIGAELKSEVFKKYGKSIYFILISEGMLAFILVFAAVTLVTKKIYLGLLFGAIASATDPASTVNVLWEYKSRGPLTTTLTSIVALDDGLALILYGLVSVFSKAMIANESYSLLGLIGGPLVELFKCVLVGALAGIILVRIIARFAKDAVLSLSLGAVAVVVGLSIYLHLDLILTSMIMGAVITNIIPKISEALFARIKELTVPLYVFFFVFVGASLDIHVFKQVSLIMIVVVYLFSRSAGKIFGAMFGGWLAKAKKTVTLYSGLCLFTQGGVAIGLAMSISHNFTRIGPNAAQVGSIIVTVVAATTFVVQLIGPIFVKFGIVKADEAWRNVTEEDIIENSRVSDFMREDFSFIKENENFDKIMEVVQERDAYHFPVVNNRGELTGLISLGGLRSILRETQLSNVILAKDVAAPVRTFLYPGQPLREAFEIFDKKQLDYLPVVKDEDSRKIVGVLEYRALTKSVSRKTLERQKSLDATNPA
ncbi:MAG: cation:proton antiporter [Candidatus Omnitrophica bacterium]|nr:cation:proton antiporter [Candidatus Omnitrophota bacterium]MDD5081090.1 cation:proton antiporter [Candidatus Omnitrophota bacterium]